MGMPSIQISFSEIAASAVKRGERGIIAMIIKDKVPTVNPVICASEIDVPTSLSNDNQQQIKLALQGYLNAPKKVIAYVLAKDAPDYTEALNYLKTVKFNYLVVPTVETDAKTGDIVSYVKAERDSKKLIKAVLPNTIGNTEGIINYATEKVYEGSSEFSTEKYCSRIAGIIAGTPMDMSCTYAPLPELTDCTRLTKEEMDAAVDAGKFIVWFDGEKVKTARAVNSLTTLTKDKNTQFQKIKIVDAMDMIQDDIRACVEDNYLGKYANSYDNKCLLLSAVRSYFEQLQKDSVLSEFSVEIDIEANRTFLKSKGVDVDAMSDDDIKVENTGSFVFLRATLKILDAIEDIVLPITI